MESRPRFLIASLLCCASGFGQATQSGDNQNTASPAPSSQQVQMTVSPAFLHLATGKTGQFTAEINGSANVAPTWAVSGPGCTGAACGTISADGLYTAPLAVPNPPAVRVTATSKTGLNATAVVNLAETVFKVGSGVTPPRAVFSPDPEYSNEARHAKYQGTCILQMIVGSDGIPRDIKITRPVGRGLDEKAIEAVRRWKFRPAKKDGVPVAVQVSVEITFRLYDGPPPKSERGALFKTMPYTEAQLAQLHTRWDQGLANPQELLRLRTECAPYTSLSVGDLEKKKAPLPPHECAAVLRWMRDLRVETLYASGGPS
jgi:TonB family protein